SQTQSPVIRTLRFCISAFERYFQTRRFVMSTSLRDRLLLDGGRWTTPAQVRLPRRRDLVEPGQLGGVRGGMHHLRVGSRLLGYLFHRRDEAVQRLLRFGLGWLYHQ